MSAFFNFYDNPKGCATFLSEVESTYHFFVDIEQSQPNESGRRGATFEYGELEHDAIEAWLEEDVRVIRNLSDPTR